MIKIHTNIDRQCPKLAKNAHKCSKMAKNHIFFTDVRHYLKERLGVQTMRFDLNQFKIIINNGFVLIKQI